MSDRREGFSGHTPCLHVQGDLGRPLSPGRPFSVFAPQNGAPVQTAVVREAFSRVFGEVPLRSSGLRLDRPLISRGGPFFSILAVRNRNEVGANTAARQSSRAGVDHDCRPGLWMFRGYYKSVPIIGNYAVTKAAWNSVIRNAEYIICDVSPPPHIVSVSWGKYPSSMLPFI
jgi:hypothetical protein